jgi:hypothetical protein
MNHYVSLPLTNRKSSVHLHALYSPRTALRTFNGMYSWSVDSTVRISRESPCGGGGSGAVRGESLLVGGLKGCYWWKTVWRIRELHCYIQTENIKQLRVACSECTFTVYCACCDNVLIWITLKSSERMKAYCLLFVQWLWSKCFQDG